MYIYIYVYIYLCIYIYIYNIYIYMYINIYVYIIYIFHITQSGRNAIALKNQSYISSVWLTVNTNNNVIDCKINLIKK